jgi:hypothetical protein
MVITRQELIASLQKETRILQHLMTKIDRGMLDYRPTPKQRSTIEWIRYLSMVGPVLLKSAKAGAFDVALWTAEAQAAEAKSFDQLAEAIAALSDQYPALVNAFSDADFRAEIEMFGNRSSIGFFIINTVLCTYAAYRTQLFNYLKACGRTELSTMNLWAGMDAPVAAV